MLLGLALSPSAAYLYGSPSGASPPPPPSGFAYVVNSEGAFLVNETGAFLISPTE